MEIILGYTRIRYSYLGVDGDCMELYRDYIESYRDYIGGCFPKLGLFVDPKIL